MVVGEGPGKNEDLQGEPFVGAAGQLLNKLFGYVGINRDEVYITNIIKCRPPGNRDPLPGEVTSCSGYLDRQVNLIRPAVILLLGRHAVQRLRQPVLHLAGHRGQAREESLAELGDAVEPAA